ncbi:short-chain dehydrogenase [Paramagnetospirillum marisnigri]|uniref:Short-chain dehydrogenase n=1 Tax=Paramagnetospirillum marisnigri TaxID=1285242 RepID=A0A178M5F2_9PROT|nr:SDR family oxidoreductase [Paramagnetospirillum marisnigri]OAN42937.1 short-chain dehydrogenase [Paramagnetospirillum marisnigri]
MSNSLQDKVAVITGAGSGIGRSMADTFLAQGAKIVVFGRNPAPLAEIAANNQDRVLVVPGDVTNADDLSRLVAESVKRFGGVDIVIPNAGIAKVASFADSDTAAIHQQFSVNFVGAVQTVRGFLPHIRKGGSVLFVTTFLTQVGFPGLAIYSASKAALKSFSQTLAAELAPQGIRVNSVAPGPIATPIWGSIGLPPDVLQAVAGQVTARLLPGAFGEPADIAKTAAFLCSDAAKNIWGQEIVVDGGYTVG